MKQTLHSKQKLALRLSGYAASAGALLAIGPSAKSQVTYSGMQNIDVPIPDTYLEIDLDGDLVNDFGFYGDGYYLMYSYSAFFSKVDIGYAVLVNPRTESYANSWITRLGTVTIESSSYVYSMQGRMVDGLELGEMIDSQRSQWINSNNIDFPGALGVQYAVSYYGPYFTYYNSWEAGEFLGQEKYIGVRFYIGTEQHYGWIRLSMGEDVEPVTIIDWAYEETPGVPIQAGDGLGVSLPPYLRITGGAIASTIPERTLTISASDEISGLEIGDIQVTNGTAENLTEVTAGYEYTVDITAEAEGNVVVEIPAGSVTFASGGDNTSVSSGWNYDITGPDVYLYPDAYNYTNQLIDHLVS